MRERLWVLEGHEPVRAADLLSWAQWMEKGLQVVARTEVVPGAVVSTVFLGLDHGYGRGPPLVFETMAFLPGGDRELLGRYSTWAAAERGHVLAIKDLHNRMVAAADGVG